MQQSMYKNTNAADIPSDDDFGIAENLVESGTAEVRVASNPAISIQRIHKICTNENLVIIYDSNKPKSYIKEYWATDTDAPRRQKTIRFPVHIAGRTLSGWSDMSEFLLKDRGYLPGPLKR